MFPGSLTFLCLLFSLTNYLFQYLVSHFYCVSHRLNFRARRDTGFYCLVVHDLGGVQVVLGTLLGVWKNLKNYQVTIFLSLFVTIFKRCSSFLQPSGLRCKNGSENF